MFGSLVSRDDKERLIDALRMHGPIVANASEQWVAAVLYAEGRVDIDTDEDGTMIVTLTTEEKT